MGAKFSRAFWQCFLAGCSRRIDRVPIQRTLVPPTGASFFRLPSATHPSVSNNLILSARLRIQF